MSTPRDPHTPEQMSTPDVWDLHARTDRISTVAARWRGIAAAVKDAADKVDGPAKALYDGPWEGDAADTFDAHRRKLTGDIDATAQHATAVATTLDNVAGSISSAQGHLTEEWAKVTGIPFVYDGPAHLVFTPRDTAQKATLVNSITRCRQLRKELDSQLSVDVADFEKTRRAFQQTAATWLDVANGATDPFTLPPEADRTGVIFDGNRVIVNTGPGDDTVQISVDPKSGMQVVVINGGTYYFPPGADVVVRTGEGNDTVTVAPGTKLRFTLLGGKGDDTIRGGDGDDTILGLDGRDKVYAGAGKDRVSGGADRDYIEGGAGDDIISGGLGDDTVYGMSGNDAITGGEGQDYLEGATGNDTIDGGAGNDIVSGGRDDDTMRGGAGNDTFYDGRGHDTADGGRGTDKVFGEATDTSVGVEQTVTVEIKDLGSFIKVDGPPEFRERVEADLELLRSSPRGQEMLTALQKAHDDGAGGWLWWHHEGDTLTIQQFPPNIPDNSFAIPNGKNHIIQYNQHLDGFTMGNGRQVEGPPVVVLYHEMAHTYDFMKNSLADGTYQGPDNPGVPNLEREAVGLPIDDDNDPNTPDRIYPKHPYDLTENGLRDEMGAPHRDAY
jgi:Ca2+-binding RTX toxin-like protein